MGKNRIISSKDIERDKINQELLCWFRQNKRDLPWRHCYRPYEVWISEIMLQQTQMDRVIPYFLRWMERFPSLHDIAEAQEEEVLKFWEGLGYYSRVRNIRKAAQMLLSMGYETIPPNENILRELPGIGPYTAGAILSIAYNMPYTAIDGNVRRVLSRIADIAIPVNAGEGKVTVDILASQLLPHDTPRDFNQALMELGALICIPQFPQCIDCPVSPFCQAYKKGTEKERPVVLCSDKLKKVEAVAALILCKDMLLLRQRPLDGPWSGLWELPWGIKDSKKDYHAIFREELPKKWMGTQKFHEIGAVQHSIMNTRIHLQCYTTSLPYAVPGPVKRPFRWVSFENISALTYQAGTRKLLDLFFSKKR